MSIFIKQNKLFLVFIFTTIIGSGLHFTFANSTSSYPIEGKVVELFITLGRGPSCTGRGVCKVKIATASSNQDVNAKGRMYFNKANKLILDVYKQNISVKTKDQQIVDDKFEIIDSYTVPANIIKQLGGDARNYTIPIGKYEVKETKNSFVIEFN